MRQVSVDLSYVIHLVIQLLEKDNCGEAKDLLEQIEPQIKDADAKDTMIETLNHQRLEAEAGRQRARRDLRNLFSRCRIELLFANEYMIINKDRTAKVPLSILYVLLWRVNDG